MIKDIVAALIPIVAAALIVTLGWLVAEMRRVRNARAQECQCPECAKPELPPYVEDIDAEWDDYQWDAYEEYAAEFTALFNSYETKWARNGALMIRTGNAGSFRFAKKG